MIAPLMRDHQPPERLAPRKMALSRSSADGKWDLKLFERLTPLLSSSEGVVSCSFRGEVDASRRQLLHVHVIADLQMACQTCFGPLKVPVDSEYMLHIVKREEDADGDTDCDPLVIVDEDDTSSLALAEDELILCLPVVANHEPGECNVPEALMRAGSDEDTEDGTVPNPFSVLSTIKKT